MDDADLEIGGLEGVANDIVIAAGTLDDDDEIANIMDLRGVSDLFGSGLKSDFDVFEICRWDQDVIQQIALQGDATGLSTGRYPKGSLCAVKRLGSSAGEIPVRQL